jgi:glycosyltransferase 2 family protein
MKTTKILKSILLLLGIFVLLMFFFSIDMDQLIIGLSKLNLTIISAIVFFTFLNVLVKAYRWKFLVYKITKKQVSVWFAFKSILAGVAAGSFTPGRGGEVAKPLMLKLKYGISISKSLPGIIIERMFDLSALILLFFLSLIAVPSDTIYVQSIALFSAVLIVLFILLIIAPAKLFSFSLYLLDLLPLPKSLHTRIVAISTDFFNGFKILRDTKSIVLVSILSILSMLLEVSRLLILFLVFTIPITFAKTTFAFASSIVIGTLTMIPGGIGATEVSQAKVIENIVYVANVDFLKNAILIDRFIAYYLLIILGAMVLIFMKSRKRIVK